MGKWMACAKESCDVRVWVVDDNAQGWCTKHLKSERLVEEAVDEPRKDLLD